MRCLYVSIVLPAFCLCLSCGDDGGDTTGDGGAAGEEGDSGGSSSTSGGTGGRGGSSGASGGTGGSATSGSICERGCRIVTALDCPEQPPDCVAGCEDGFATVRAQFANCVEEYTAAIECTVGHPASDWQCSAAGLAQLNAAFCNTELETFTTCAGL